MVITWRGATSSGARSSKVERVVSTLFLSSGGIFYGRPGIDGVPRPLRRYVTLRPAPQLRGDVDQCASGRI